jgi:hypothetical protein
MSGEVPVDAIHITDETTRVEIEEAITHVLASMRRLPGVPGYRERAHARVDALLCDWEVATLRETLARDEREYDGA